MASIESTVAALYRDPALAAYGFVLAGSVEGGEALVRDAVLWVLSRRRRLSSGAASAVRERMVASQCAALSAGGAARSRGPVPSSLGAADRAVMELDPWVRTAMVLRYRDDRPVPDVAKALRRSTDAVDELLRSGREVLAARLGVSAAEVSRMAVADGA